MGYVRGFVHGGIVGVVAGLCIAPQTGDRTRAQLSGVASAAREGFSVAQRTARRVAPFATLAVGTVREKVQPGTPEDEDDLSSAVRIHNQTNGRH
ncbi:MAG: YtxH domain-containing protein [Candidatus Dormibacteria bacterium]